MAMLSGPKRKQRLILQPRGKPLYEIDSKGFGSKMLAKMGWEPGKGLGVKEDGGLDFIKIRYKNDSEGMGFQERNDQWTQHESKFNQLLKNLSTPNSDDDNVDSSSSPKSATIGISGESLEEKSKKSRSRVHYKKYTKGKDLTQYSEKDLANIFGKKSLNGPEFVPAAAFQASDSEDEKTEEPKSSVQTVTSSISMNEYFKMKMKKIKNCDQSAEYVEDANVVEGEEVIQEPIKKKKKNKNKSSEDVTDLEKVNIKESETVEKQSKKSKKSKRKSLKEDDGDVDNCKSNVLVEVPIMEEIEEQLKKSKTKKKKSNAAVASNCESITELVRTKKNKRTLLDEEAVTCSKDDDVVKDFLFPEDDVKSENKKEKKKKKKEIVEEDEVKAESSPPPKKKKKNKNKTDIQNEEDRPQQSTSSSSTIATTVISNNTIRQAELEFNRARNQYISEYFQSCKTQIAKSICILDPVLIEHVRCANLHNFHTKKSNIGTIVGYGLTSDMEIKVDEEKKMNLENLLKLEIKQYVPDWKFDW